MREELRGRGGLVGAIGSETIAIVRPEDAETYARRVLTRLAGAAAGIGPGVGAGVEAQVSIGISDSHADLGDLGAAHREAVTASAVAERSGSTLLQFRDLGTASAAVRRGARLTGSRSTSIAGWGPC